MEHTSDYVVHGVANTQIFVLTIVVSLENIFVFVLSLFLSHFVFREVRGHRSIEAFDYFETAS